MYLQLHPTSTAVVEAVCAPGVKEQNSICSIIIISSRQQHQQGRSSYICWCAKRYVHQSTVLTCAATASCLSVQGLAIGFVLLRVEGLVEEGKL